MSRLSLFGAIGYVFLIVKCNLKAPKVEECIFFVFESVFFVYSAPARPAYQKCIFCVFSGLAGFIGSARPAELQV